MLFAFFIFPEERQLLDPSENFHEDEMMQEYEIPGSQHSIKVIK